MRMEEHGQGVNLRFDPSRRVCAWRDSWRERDGPSGHEQESLVPWRSSGNRRDMMT